MATEFNDTGRCDFISSVKNEDGSYTYTARITGLVPTWQYVTEHNLEAEVLITVKVPDDVGVPGERNVFRFDELYNVNITGQDWS